MTDQTRQFSVRPYGDRWGIAIDDEVVLVANTLEEARSVVTEAAEVLTRSGYKRRPEKRTFARDED